MLRLSLLRLPGADFRPTLLLVLLALSGLTQASFESARTEFERQNYEEALTLLDDAQRNAPDPRILRYLALSHYYLGDYEQAHDTLARVLRTDPEDPELLYAFADTLLGIGKAHQALPYVQSLQKKTTSAATTLLLGRIWTALARYTEANKALAEAIQSADPAVHQAAAVVLTRNFLRAGRLYEAEGTTQRAIEVDPESLDADILRGLQAHTRSRSKPSFSLDAGYRFEHDNNVPLEPRNVEVPGLSDREASRQVFTVDALGRVGLGEDFLLLGEAHLYQSLHEELDRFDQTNQNYVLALGWSAGRWGLRLPVELQINHIDHDRFLLAYEAAPGAYLEVGQGSLHAYGRYAKNDFDEEGARAEDRSGTALGGGVWFHWPFDHRRGRLRAVFEHNRDDTEGQNWQRDETQLYLMAEYSPLSRLTLGLGYQRDDHGYRNVHDLFFQKRDDQGDTFFLSAAWRLNAQWDVRFQALRADWKSNLPVYEYEREIYSVGINWKLK